jgi:hypothetical protein
MLCQLPDNIFITTANEPTQKSQKDVSIQTQRSNLIGL